MKINTVMDLLIVDKFNSMEALAQELDISVCYLWCLRNNKRHPSKSLKIDIENALKAPWNILLTEISIDEIVRRIKGA